MADGLKALGVQATPTEDGIEIVGGQIGGGDIECHHDHRIAMSFSVAALRASDPIHIRGADNVATSFPNFIELAKQVGMCVEVAK